jgi:hypothetical protein
LGLVLAVRRGPAKAAGWLLVAGLACGLIPGTRPPGLAFCLAGVGYSLWQWRGRSWPFFLGCLSALPALIWNGYWFKEPLFGGYSTSKGALNLTNIPIALPGLLFSPSRGLLIFSPIVIVAIFGLIYLLWRKRRQPEDHLILVLFAACCVILFNYSCFAVWWGGGSYGPRFITDLLPTLCLLIGYGLVWLTQLKAVKFKAALVGRRILTVLVVAAAAYSTLVQYAGVAAKPSSWNGAPIYVDITAGHDRLWQWSDSQPIRHIRGLYYQNLSATQTTPQALQSFHGAILRHAVPPEAGTRPVTRPVTSPVTSAATVIQGLPSTFKLLQVAVQNQSPYPWYGCDYGFGKGETYVHGTIVAQKDHKPMGTVLIFITGKYQPQQVVTTIGPVLLPPEPGHYELQLWPAIAGIGPLNPDPKLAYKIPLEVIAQPL